MNDNIFDKFGSYVRGVLDRNKNGRIDLHEILSLFPNFAIAIAALFVDLVVLVGEYRVFDFGMKISDGDIFKAAGFVLASAVPFYLGQLFWLYPRANGLQRFIAASMMAGGLWMSATMGFADLTKQINVQGTVNNVIWFSVGCVVATIVYIMRDEGIMAWRMKVTTLAAADLEKIKHEVMRSTLKSLKETMKVQDDIVQEFGEEAVKAQLNAMNSKRAYAQTAERTQEKGGDGNLPS